MEILTRYKNTPSLPATSVVTIGNFDGVHLCHQGLLQRVQAACDDDDYSGLITFNPHPVDILAPHKAPGRLTQTPRKMKLLENWELDFTLLIPFDREFAATPAEEFIEEILVRFLRVKHMVVGPDSQFGQGRRGNAEMLRTFGAKHGFTVEEVSPILLGQDRISSSTIRKLLGSGEVEKASHMLSRPHQLLGLVKPGEQRGRTIGFPTANLHVEGRLLLPKNGVYVGRAKLAEGSFSAVINIGERPTFAGQNVSVEAHLLDYDGDCYDQPMALDFLSRIRDEKKFASAQDLVVQIREDVETTRTAIQKLS